MILKTKFKQLFLLGGDIIILYLSLYLSLCLRHLEVPSFDLWQKYFSVFSFVFILWILIFYIAGLYDLYLAVNNSKFFQLYINCLIVASIFSVAFFYIVQQVQISPKTSLLIFIVVFGFLFFLWRRFFNWSLKSYLPKTIIAIIGINQESRELIKEIKENPHLGYKIAFALDLEKDDFSNLEQDIIYNKVNTIVLASDIHKFEELRKILFKSRQSKINYVNTTSFYEMLTGKIPVFAIDRIWFLENLNRGDMRLFSSFKRVYDIILALIFLIITLPVWPIIGLIIKLDKGTVFFRQKRVGKNEVPFILIKFRTMRMDAEDQGPKWASKNDSRATRFGSFLRIIRIDEIPQVINILRGEMSFIGPRPERPEFVKQLKEKIPFYNERHLIKPGLTGWAQINYQYGASEEDALKKLQYDLFYVKNRSIYLDVSILLKTISTVLSRGGR